jgi:hypothetical protein
MTRNLLAFFVAFALFGQPPVAPPPPNADSDATFPNGKSQREAILKQDHKKNLEDAAQMAKLAQEVSDDIEKDDRYVVSMKTLKKLDDIEKLTKSIRGRLKKY